MSGPLQSQDEALLQELGLATDQMLESLDDNVERERFTRLLLRTLDKYPFFGSMIMQMQVHTGRAAMRWTKTACVFVLKKDLGLHLAFNPFFLRSLERVYTDRGEGAPSGQDVRSLMQQGYWVWQNGPAPKYLQQVLDEHGIAPRRDNEWLAVKLDIDYQVAVLIHEFRHILLRHLESDLSLFPDRQMLNIAQDVSCNQNLPNLPPVGITLHTWEPWGLELPPNESYAVYYKALKAFFAGLPRGQQSSSSKDEQVQSKKRVQGLPMGTPVTRADGRSVPIEKIAAGDVVFTLDEQGNRVERRVWHVRKSPLANQETDHRLPTSMFQIDFASGRSLRRASGRTKVVAGGPGQGGIGIGALLSNPRIVTVGTRSAAWPKVEQLAPGDHVVVLTASGVATDEVVRIQQVVARPDELLFQLGVLATQGALSGFFANGVWTRGLQVEPPPPTQPPGGGPDKEQDPPSENDGDSVQTPTNPQHVWRVGDKVQLRDGRTGVVTAASAPDDEGLQDLEIDVEDT